MTWRWHLDSSAPSDKCGITFRRVTEGSDEMLPPLHPSMLSERLRSFKGAPIAEPQPQKRKRKRDLDDVGDIRRFRRVRLLDAVSRCNVYYCSALDHECGWRDLGVGFGRTRLIQVSP
jgi:hypothetical protein